MCFWPKNQRLWIAGVNTRRGSSYGSPTLKGAAANQRRKVVENDTAKLKRLLALQFSVGKMVCEGTRSVDGVARVLQLINDEPGFEAKFFPSAPPNTAAPPNFTLLLQEWQTLLKELFDQEIDISKLQIPQYQPGFNWLVLNPGLSLKEIIGKARKLFKL